MSGNEGVSKARIIIRVTSLLVVGTALVSYASFRAGRAALDIERAKDTASLVLKAQAEADQTTRAGAFLGTLAGFSKGEEATRAVMGMWTRGDSDKLEEAAKYAKACDLELQEPPSAIGRAFYSNSSECKMMFHTLGMPVSMKQAGMTVTDTLLRAFGDSEHAGGTGALAPACREWSITGAVFRMPDTNAEGEAWDFNDGLPDPRFSIRSGPVDWTHGPESTDAMEYDRMLPKAYVAMPGQRIEVKVVDVDTADDDVVSEDSVELPERIEGDRIKVGHADVTLVCTK